MKQEQHKILKQKKTGRNLSFLWFVMALCLFSVPVKSQNLLVKIYSLNKIKEIKFQPEIGKYELLSEGDKEKVHKQQPLQVEASGSKVIVLKNGKTIAESNQVKFQAEGFKNIFSLSPSGKNIKGRTYEGSLIIQAKNSELVLINDIDIENYVAGVVQSEIYGKPDKIDIFKVQAVISRTYALKNINKHIAEGFNLCDDEHCQVYKNRCIKPEILQGVLAVKGEVLTDSVKNLIDTPFHSNSGGQTANSEDVWSKPVAYLRAQPDTFSFSMRNSVWEKTMTKEDWLYIFSDKYKLDVKSKEIQDELLNFQQEERKAQICSIPLKQIRTDLNLRSTYFSVECTENDMVKLKGKGYGHGVGLSQEGAIRMVELGYDYTTVLQHYYSGAKIIHIAELQTKTF